MKEEGRTLLPVGLTGDEAGAMLGSALFLACSTSAARLLRQMENESQGSA